MIQQWTLFCSALFFVHSFAIDCRLLGTETQEKNKDSEMNSFLSTVSFLLLPVIALGAGPWKYDQVNRETCEWSYSAPEEWGQCAEYKACSAGLSQSPIVINRASSPMGDLSPLDFSNYSPFSPTYVNNGHTVMLQDNANLFVNMFGETFYMRQLHFHSPAEHQIQGETFPLEVHFVHTSQSNNYLVIGVFFKLDPNNKPNVFLKDFWSALPKIGSPAETMNDTKFDAKGFFDSLENKNYYHYNGSLTTPPCTETVKWIVMESPSYVNTDEISGFANVIPFSNNRPTQKLNGRTVQYYRETPIPVAEDSLLRHIGIAAGFAAFAGFVAVGITLIVEKFGGMIGGALGASPTTIIPISIGMYLQSPSSFEFKMGLFTVAVGMLMNSGFLFIWKMVPNYIPQRYSSNQSLLMVLVISLGSWFIVALGAASFIQFVILKLESSLYIMLGFTILCIVLHVVVGLSVVLFTHHTFPKVKNTPTRSVIFLRGLFTVLVSFIAIMLSSYSGVVSGMASIFPAIFSTTMVSLWLTHGPELVQGTACAMMFGGVSVSVYALLFATLVPLVTVIPAVIASYIAAVLTITIPSVKILRWVVQRSQKGSFQALSTEGEEEGGAVELEETVNK